MRPHPHATARHRVAHAREIRLEPIEIEDQRRRIDVLQAITRRRRHPVKRHVPEV
jgi:hypothetical protein